MKFILNNAWLGRAGYVIAAVLAGCGDRVVANQPVFERMERYGDIEVVIRSHGGPEAAAATADNDWSLRYQGQALAIDSFGGMWLDQPMRSDRINNVFVVGAGSPPDLLVNIGDPNNASAYHLLSQDGAGLSTPLLCKTFGGDNAVRVIDGVGAGQEFFGPQYRSLVGARRLMLGATCLYDVASRRAHPIPRHPDDVYFPYDAKGLLFSPSGERMARFAKENGSDQAVLLCADLVAGTWTRLPIDAERMRFPDFSAINDGWLAYHFDWRIDADGRERLIERPDFVPLPRRGAFMVNAAQYDLPGIYVPQFERLGEFLSRRFGGKLLSDQITPGPGRQLLYEVEQEEVVVTASGYYIAMGTKPYWPGQPGDPKLQKDLIRRIGTAFDAELAEGRHEAMFQRPTEAKP